VDLVKTVLESWILLPYNEGVLQVDVEEKRLVQAVTGRVDLAEEVYAYALELGSSVPNSQTATRNLKRKTGKRLLLALPWTATEPQVREVAAQYLQRGTQARQEGNYANALKQLERGWNLLQQWEVRNGEMSLQLGVVLAHFGKKDEAVTVLRGTLQ